MITDESQINAEAACRRKDFRRFFESHQPPVANCLTLGGSFRDRVQDLSSKGVFYETLLLIGGRSKRFTRSSADGCRSPDFAAALLNPPPAHGVTIPDLQTHPR